MQSTQHDRPNLLPPPRSIRPEGFMLEIEGLGSVGFKLEQHEDGYLTYVGRDKQGERIFFAAVQSDGSPLLPYQYHNDKMSPEEYLKRFSASINQSRQEHLATFLTNVSTGLPENIREQMEAVIPELKGKEATQIISSLKERYGFETTTSSSDFGDMGKYTVTDYAGRNLIEDLRAFEKSLAKYPPGYLKSLNIDKVLFAGEITDPEGETYTGLASTSIFSNKLALVINASSTGNIDHEFYHVTDYENGLHWGNNQAFLDHAYNGVYKQNTEAFRYGHSEGHASQYGAKSADEGQAEIVRLLFTKPLKLKKLIASDPSLAKAVDFMKAELYAVSNRRIDQDFWATLEANPRQGNHFWDSYWTKRADSKNWVRNDLGERRLRELDSSN